jgi:hypothetical protein
MPTHPHTFWVYAWHTMLCASSSCACGSRGRPDSSAAGNAPAAEGALLLPPISW